MEATRELFTGGMLLLTGLIMASGSEGGVLVLALAVVVVGLWCFVVGVIKGRQANRVFDAQQRQASRSQGTRT